MPGRVLTRLVTTAEIKRRIGKATKAMRVAGAEAVLKEAKRTVHKITRNLHDSGEIVERGDKTYVSFPIRYARYEEELHPFLRPALRKRQNIISAMTRAGRKESRRASR